MNVISYKLKKIRKDSNLSREALAEMCGMSSKTIQRIEDGESVSEETIRKIENALGISLKDTYTKNQLKAIRSKSKNLLMIAGAGAGKTKTIEARIVEFIENGTRPSEIIAWTFTEKAANELNVRVKKLLKSKQLYEGSSEMIIGTIHSSCLKLLQEYTDKYNGYQVLTPMQNIHFVNRYFEEIGVGNIRKINSNDTMIRYKDTLKFINIVNIITENPTSPLKVPCEIKVAISNYKKLLKDNKYFDFTTIQETLLYELKENVEFKREIRNTFKYVIVDEYQDVNYLQEKIISNLIELGINSTVVGDADQAIYQFRGSDYTNINSFDTRYSDVEVVKLEENFRSTEGIVNIAQSVINYNSNRREKDMKSVNGGYELGDISYKRFQNEEDEYDFIAERILDLQYIGMNLNEIAILIRKNSIAEKIIKSLQKKKIKYVVENVNKLLETKEIKACINIFRYLNGEITKGDLIDSWNCIDYELSEDNIIEAVESLEKWKPKVWGNGKKYIVNQEYLIQKIFKNFYNTLDELKELEGNVSSKLENILFNLGKFTQLINDFETINFDMSPDMKITLFCSFLKYNHDQYPEGYLDNVYAKRDGVKIMTIHKSKGLQFSAVFVPGLTKNMFPIKRIGGVTEWHFMPKEAIKNYKVLKAEGNSKSESQLRLVEDERRLFYVAATRSRKFLFLTGSTYNKQCVKQSTFIQEALDAKGYIFEYNPNCYNIRGRNRWKSYADDEDEIYLDFSTLSDYYVCPYKFKLSHIYGFVEPINLRMGYGNSIHNMAKEINKYALSSDEEIDREKVEKIIKNNFHLPYIGKWEKTKQQMFSKAEKCIKGYIDKNIKEFKNIEFVEKYIEMEVGKNIHVSGRIDLVLKRDISGKVFVYIIDYKTNEKANTEIENKIQTNIYSIGYKGITGKYPDFIEIIDIEKNKNISTEAVDIDELNKTIQSIAIAADEIKLNRLDKKCDKNRCNNCHKKDICLKNEERQILFKK